MPDFGALLRSPSSGQVRPTVYAIGDYPAVITKFELVPPNEKFETPVVQVRVFARIKGLPEGMSEDEVGGNPVGTVLKKDYDFKTPDGKDASKQWMLNALLESVGVAPTGNWDELLPQLVGKEVLASVGQYPAKDDKSVMVGNQINKMAGFENNP